MITKDGRTILSGTPYSAHKLKVYYDQDGRCGDCKQPVEYAETHFHHFAGRGLGSGKRDDLDPRNTVLCTDCHLAKHGQTFSKVGPQWSKGA